MKVFIVDDSVIMVERLITLLSAIPALEIVGQAHSNKEAKRLLQQVQPDVLILDIQMPGGSGVKLLQQLKEAPACPLILMVSTNAFPQYRKKCLEAGADYFFDKSTEFEQLRETLSSLTSRFVPSPQAND